MFGINNYEPPGWRYNNLPQEFMYSPLDPDVTDIYQFGVFLGGSIVTIAQSMRYALGRTNRVVGFDSWEGIPPELAEPVYEGAWAADFKGDPNQVFHPSRWLDVSDPAQVVDWVRVNVLSEIGGNFDLDLVRGWYDEVLVGEKAQWLMGGFGLKPAYYVDIDCDTYSSTVSALRFLLDNDLIIRGTVIGFDDWGGAPNDWKNREVLGGECRAWMELREEYKILGDMREFDFEGERQQRMIFRVDGVG